MDSTFVKVFLRITMLIDILRGRLHLKARQVFHDGVKHSRVTTLLQKIVQTQVAEVFLKVTSLVITDGIDMRNRKVACFKELCQIVKSIILLGGSTDATDTFLHSVILTVTATRRDFFHLLRRRTKGVDVELYQSLRFHIDMTLR